MAAESSVVIITGGSRGIGAGLVAAYRAAGSRVIAIARSIVEQEDADYNALAGDIADPATARRAVELALARYGRIDTLVNNAGVFVAKPFVAFTDEDLESQFQVNLAGFFRMTQAVAVPMLAAGSGHIVNITSSLVRQPLRAVPAVLASLTKGGIEAATRSLAIEFSERGVRVNAVSPGIIDTPMHDPSMHAALATLQPTGRLGTITDVVEAVRYLDRASFVTGEILHVDGGQSAGHW